MSEEQQQRIAAGLHALADLVANGDVIVIRNNCETTYRPGQWDEMQARIGVVFKSGINMERVYRAIAGHLEREDEA